MRGKRPPVAKRDSGPVYHGPITELRYEPERELAPDWLRIRPVFGFDDWRELFLQELALHSKMTHACLAAGIPVSRLQQYLQRARNQGIDPEFVEAVEIARTMAKEHLEISLLERAHAGDTIAAHILLKAMDPETYVHALKIDKKVESSSRVRVEITAPQLNYREAIQALAPPEVIEAESRPLPSSAYDLEHERHD